MADDRSSNPSPSPKPAGRTTPVLVPQGVLEGQPEIPLNRPVTTVGSNETARLHLLSRTVSKGHAIFVNSGGATYVADLASKSGVLVNGKLIRDAELKNGDRVQIGKFVFRYRLPANLAAAIQPVEAPPAAVIVVGWPALPVTGRVVSIGRGDRSDIALTTDSAVSAPHAAIFQVDGKWYIRDMYSRTGTHINGKAIHQSPLNFGDRIVIGSSTILFQPGAVIEDEFFSSEIEPQAEEISEPIEAPLAAVETAIPVADEPIPFSDDELPQTSDGKTALPAAAEAPVEAAAVESTDAIPLDFVEPEPLKESSRSLRYSEEPDLPATDPALRSTSESGLEVLNQTLVEDQISPVESAVDEAQPQAIEEISVEIEAPLPAAVETQITSPEELADWAATPVTVEATAEVEPVIAEPADTSATDLPLEETAAIEPVAIEQESPMEDIAVEEIAEHESAAAEDELLEEIPLAADPQPAGELDWAETSATDLTVEPPLAAEVPLEIEPEPAGEISWDAAASTDLPAEEPAAVDDAAVDWHATPATDLPVEPITEVEAPVAPAAPPVEDFVFDPAAEAVDPKAIPDELFFGDPEPEAVVVPPAIETPAIEPPAVEADPAFDAAIEESFTAPSTAPISLPDVAEELSIPEGLAAFAKASLETAETYIEATSAESPAAETIETETPLDTAADSAIGWSALIEEEEAPAENVKPGAGTDIVDAEWTDDAQGGAMGWSAVVSHDELPAEAEVPFAEIEEDNAEGEEAIGWSALVEQDEPDLNFLDFSDPVPEVSPEPPAPVDEAPKPQADPRGPAQGPAQGSAHGPSIFGFQFEGGSFLGGMPISLHQPAPEAPAEPPTVFDANRTSPSGIGEMTPPVTARSNRPVTPPRPGRPAVPPTPLPGLISDVQSPWSVAPVIPPTARSEAKGPSRPKRGLTTAFNGPGMAARTTEVFSQLAAPIGVEVFGGKPGNPNQFTVPDSKETAAQAAAEAAALAAATPEPVAQPAPKKRRRSRLPWLSLLFFGIPAGLWALMYLCPPVSSRLVSAKLLGSLQFDGLSGLSPEDVHTFHKAQEARLYSEEVREAAETILENKHQPAGFTASDDDFSKTVDTQSLNWSGNTLQFTFNTSDVAAGSAQVNAVLAALAQKDRDLDDAKARARAEADSARAATDEIAAHLQRLKEQRGAALVQAQDCPDPAIINSADQDAADLTQKYNDAHAIRQSSEAVLAELRSQDPSKPIDIEADPKIVELKKRLDPLNEQIARLKGISAVGAKSTVGTDVPLGATTQPDSDVDPLLAPLQQQADLLNQKLDQRRGELAADASMSPAQREVNMASRIENLSVKITALQKVESDAKAASDAAMATAKRNHERMSAARLAGVKAEELYAQINEIEADQKRAVQAQTDKEAALANCVTVSSSPIAAPTQLPTNDPRPPILALASGLSCVVFGLMIVGELRRPKLMTSVKPAAAPLVYPPAPVKVIPWPQPRELNGLKSTEAGVEPPPVMGDTDQVFGGV